MLTLIHVWANYVGMQILRLRTLNQERAKVALQPLVEYCSQQMMINGNTIQDVASKILPPTSVSESLWKSMVGMVRPGNIHLGMSLKDLVRRTSSLSSGDNKTGNLIKGQWEGEKYIIFICGYDDNNNTRERVKNNNMTSLVVLLQVGANDCDELKAFLHAHILDHCMHNENENVTLSHLLLRYVCF